MRRPFRLSWLRFLGAFALLVTGSSQAQRVTELPISQYFDSFIGCFARFCTSSVTALDGNTAIITGAGAGVMVRDAAGVWNLQQEMWNPDSPPPYSYPVRMGEPSAVSGDVLLLTGSSKVYNLAPVIYVWKRSGTTWSHTQVLAPPRPAGFTESTIISVQVHQKAAAVCSVQRDVATSRAQTQIDTYTLNAGRFQRNAQILPPLTPGSRCGLALEGNILLVTDPAADQGAGRVLVYERGSGGWTARRALRAADGSPNARFGSSVDLSGNVIAVGAPQRPNFDHPGHPGAVYVFQRAATGWAQVQLLVKPEIRTDPPPPEEPDSTFGESVALSGDRLATTWTSSAPEGGLLPQVYLYERRGVWAPVAGLVTYAELTVSSVLLSDTAAIQTMNIGVSFGHGLPALWTLPPRVE